MSRPQRTCLIAIEACDDLSQSNWVVLKRLTLTNGLYHFGEPFNTNNAARFYRIGFPQAVSTQLDWVARASSPAAFGVSPKTLFASNSTPLGAGYMRISKKL